MKMTVPNWVINICNILRDANEDAYVVGGAVRDTLIGRPVYEYDMCSSAKPETLHALFDKAIDTGAGFGTVTVVVSDADGQHSTEITTFRVETEYSDSRRPDDVTLGVSLEEDLGRRDFTINALAYDPLTETLVDLHNGQKDLEAKCLKTIGSPETRFKEDTLRLFRCARFAAQLGFEVEEKTIKAMKALGPEVPLPAIERMTTEIKKTLAAPQPNVGIEMLMESELLERYMPGLKNKKIDIERLKTAPTHHRLALLVQQADSPEDCLKHARVSKAELDLVQRQLSRNFDDELVALDPHDLAIKSGDLMALGLEGPKLGAAQKALFHAVCQRKVANSKTELEQYFKTQLQETL